MEEKTLKENGKLSKQQIEELKKQKNVNTVFELAIPMDDEGLEVSYAYIKKPSVTTIEASTSVGKNYPLKANAIIIRNSWLAGDERIKTAYEDDNAELLLSAAEQLDNIISVRKGTLKKR